MTPPCASVTTPLSPVCWATATEHTNRRRERREGKRQLGIFTFGPHDARSGWQRLLKSQMLMCRRKLRMPLKTPREKEILLPKTNHFVHIRSKCFLIE